MSAMSSGIAAIIHTIAPASQICPARSTRRAGNGAFQSPGTRASASTVKTTICAQFDAAGIDIIQHIAIIPALITRCMRWIAIDSSTGPRRAPGGGRCAMRRTRQYTPVNAKTTVRIRFHGEASIPTSLHLHHVEYGPRPASLEVPRTRGRGGDIPGARRGPEPLRRLRKEY